MTEKKQDLKIDFGVTLRRGHCTKKTGFAHMYNFDFDTQLQLTFIERVNSFF